MAEYSEQLRLALELEGMDKVDALTAAVKNQNLVVRDRLVASRELQKSVKEEGTAQQILDGQFKQSTDAIRGLKDEQSQLAVATDGSTAKMMKSYFTLGEEMRRTLKDMRFEHRVTNESIAAMGQVMGESVAGPLAGFMQGFSSLNFAVKGAGVAMQQSSVGGVASLGAGLTSIAVPLALVAAGVIYLIGVNKDLDEQLTKDKAKIDDLSFSLGQQSETAHRAALQRQVDEAQQRASDAAHLSFAERAEENLPGVGGIFKKKHEDARLAANAEFMESEKKLSDFEDKMDKDKLKAIADEETARQKALERRVTLAQQASALNEGSLLTEIDAMNVQIAGTKDQVERNNLLIRRNQLQADYAAVIAAQKQGTSGMGINIFGPGAPPTTLSGIDNSEASLTQRTGSGQQSMSDVIKQADVGGKALSSSWNKMTTQMGDQTAKTLAGGFTKAFGIGHTLLGSFASDFIETFTKLAESAVFAGILNVITGGAGGFLGGLTKAFSHASGGWINEPVVGFGMNTGAVHTFAEHGSEYIAPTRNAAEYGANSGAGMQSVSVQLGGEARLRGADIWLSLQRYLPLAKPGQLGTR